MSNKAVWIVLKALAVVLGAVGTFLYLASYFIGLAFMAAALALYFAVKTASEGREAAMEIVKKAFRSLLVPIAGILIAIIVGGIIMALSGYNPFAAYAALFYGGFVRNWNVSILNASPLIFTGLSVAFAFKAGLFNIGAEGQYYIGAMVATFLGITLKLPAMLSIPLIFIIGGGISAAYNYIPALLKVKTGAHEVITTMMFAHIARYMSSVFIRAMGGDSSSAHPYVSNPIQESSFLPIFKSILPEANYRLHMGIIIAIGVALFVYWILNKTTIGFEIRAVGHNQQAARAQGISVGKNVFRALLFAGFLSGLAGVNQILGLDHKLFENLQAGYGWNGISVALLASNNPIGLVFTSLLWGALDAGGQYMSRTLQTPNAIVEIIKGIILFLVVARYIYAYLRNRMKREPKAEAVKA